MRSADSELYPSMGLYLEKTNSVLVKAGVSRVKIHVAHDIELEETVMSAGKCPRSGDIQQGIATTLSASLTRLAGEFGLSSLIDETANDHLFGLSKGARGRRSTVSPTMSTVTIRRNNVVTTTQTSAVTTTPSSSKSNSTAEPNLLQNHATALTGLEEANLKCCVECTCGFLATNAQHTIQRGGEIDYINFLVGVKIPDREIFETINNDSIALIVHSKDKLISFHLFSPDARYLTHQIKPIHWGTLIRISTNGIELTNNIIVKVAARDDDSHFLPSGFYYSIRSRSHSRSRRSLLSALGIESKGDFDKYVTAQNIKTKIADLERKDFQNQLGEYGLAVVDITKTLSGVHDEICRNKFVNDQYHREAIISTRVDELVTRLLINGQDCLVKGTFDQVPASAHIVDVCKTYYSEGFCSAPATMQLFQNQIKCTTATLTVHNGTVVISYELEVPFGLPEDDKMSFWSVQTITTFNGTRAAQLMLSPNLVFVEIIKPSGQIFTTTIECQRGDSTSFICNLRRVDVLHHACISAVRKNLTANVCPIQYFNNHGIQCEVVNLHSGLLISADPPLEVFETQTDMTGFETQKSLAKAQKVMVVGHGSDKATECGGIRYQTAGKPIVTFNISSIDKVEIQSMSNNLGWDHFELHHKAAHRTFFHDVSDSYESYGPSWKWLIAIVALSITVASFCIYLIVKWKNYLTTRYRRMTIRRRARRSMELVENS